MLDGGANALLGAVPDDLLLQVGEQLLDALSEPIALFRLTRSGKRSSAADGDDPECSDLPVPVRHRRRTPATT
jgi:hypothetical protein